MRAPGPPLLRCALGALEDPAIARARARADALGLVRSSGRVPGSTKARAVNDRSVAEIPVVVPFR